MYNPVSTYRIQFNKDFTFEQFKKNIRYFLSLGLSTIYASPVFEATPGSIHGYDVTNPQRINPEIGQYDDLKVIIDVLKSNNVGWIQDIVPNHMAFHMNNLWLMDVLENGPSSKYLEFFDIDLSHPGLNGKILIPFLGKTTEDALTDGDLLIGWEKGNFVFRYFDSFFPLNSGSFNHIINSKISDAPNVFLKLLKRNSFSDRSAEKQLQFKDEIGTLYNKSPEFAGYINRLIEYINSDLALKNELLEKQHYKLSFWTEASTILNYRRFFTVNELICLGMEHKSVFETYHTFIEKQLRERKFDGLRIDHVDGLQKPVQYLEKLRFLSGEHTYIVTEKILEKDEELFTGLPVQGTSGYDYLAIVNNVLTHKENYYLLYKFFRKITGIKKDIDEIIYEKKKLILTKGMQGEWDNLTRMFIESVFPITDKEIIYASIKAALGECLVLFPVYKLYSDCFPLPYDDTKIIREILNKVGKMRPSLLRAVDAIEIVFLEQTGFSNEDKERALKFYLRFMQFTGPLMAKGLEDTVMYYYNCFICHNEVGDNPGSDGISVEEYHDLMRKRQRNWPMSMNATSTHDTKRGEDVRARLNVISEMPQEWIRNVKSWRKSNKSLKRLAGDRLAPDANEEYFIYQTLTGVFPVDGVADEMFMKRVEEYLIKALREGKSNTDWNTPDEDYEKAVIEFVRRILDPRNAFLKTFIPFQQRISNFGIINSLTQLMLKAMSPGIPDFYQGTELWDFSMVDPDNRRPVNYEKRAEMLQEIVETRREEPETLFHDLLLNRTDGRIKLWMTHLLMEERKSEPELFANGSYLPLKADGRFASHVLAFARVYKNKWYIVIAPLFVSILPENEMRPGPGSINWEDTRVILPETAPEKWIISSGKKDLFMTGQIFLSDIMRIPCPVFVKGVREEVRRSAGVLAHISSLPGRYGTGGLGEEAYEFADILRNLGQSYWQILPFNPVGKGYGFSPYSSTSAFAGNLMFLDPDLLVKNRLLPENYILRRRFRESEKTNFNKAIELRKLILNEIFDHFFSQTRPYQQKEFIDFCDNQKYWLNDYSLFNILKKEFNNETWNSWPEKIKNRDKKVLKGLFEKYGHEIKEEKLGQFLFQKQWMALKGYSNKNGIKLIGDMSYYVNYDSVEVWAHPRYFKLDANKDPFYVAGVPPDFFSSTGQLWNMPVYNWEIMKLDGYEWWMNRIRRNMEMCDLVRFDHFRGFSDYWEVPYGESTAVNGRWTPGPGNEFFAKIKREFPEMPFIAEDLGHIDDKVYKLRDDYSMPGMVILHFAFGDNTPGSIYIPHNHVYNSIVYTGTHDNNTTRGWYKNELNDRTRKVAEEYFGHSISEDSSHEEFIRMAYSSVARLAIIPVQDILGLDESARLNRPSTAEKNWDWKMKRSDFNRLANDKIRRMAILFGRF